MRMSYHSMTGRLSKCIATNIHRNTRIYVLHFYICFLTHKPQFYGEECDSLATTTAWLTARNRVFISFYIAQCSRKQLISRGKEIASQKRRNKTAYLIDALAAWILELDRFIGVRSREPIADIQKI